MMTLGSLFDGSGGFCLAGLINGITPVWSSEIEPYCCRVTAERFPNVKQLGDIRNIDGGKIQPVDIITFGSPCILRGSLIHTDSGYKPIEKVTIMDRVLTHTGEYKQVLKSCYTGHKAIWEISTMSGRVRATDDHKFYARRKTAKDTYTDPEFVPLKDLDGSGSWFVALPIDEVSENPMRLSPDECWLIGRYIADGYIRNVQRKDRPAGSLYNAVIFCVGEKKQEEFERNAEKYQFGKAKVQKGCAKYTLWNTRLVQLCEDCGLGAENKTFPQWVLNLPEDLLECVLRGYLSGDGCKIGNIVKAATVSLSLAMSVGYAVAKVYHKPFAIYKNSAHGKAKKIEGRNVNQKDWYQIVWRQEIKKKSFAFYDDGKIWMPVNAVYPLHYKDAVYDLTVEDDHSFCVNNVAVHNCQDLSVAGKQAGIHEGARSNLFFEAVRIIKEMRDATAAEFPRFAVWENVPGAYSSNKGEDFRAVLETLASVKGGDVSVPRPQGGGGWKRAGAVVGTGYSIAWRTYDAQFWGVPQRRKRIYLIADFASERAGEILFEPEGCGRDPAEGGEAREDPARNAEGST